MSGYYIQEHKYPNIMDVWNDTTKSSNTHATAQETPTSTGPNMLLTGILMGLVIIFSITLCYMTLPTLIRWVRKKVPVSEARVQRRYETVEGWLISKVRCYFETSDSGHETICPTVL